jgi:hypothetical protein
VLAVEPHPAKDDARISAEHSDAATLIILDLLFINNPPIYYRISIQRHNASKP